MPSSKRVTGNLTFWTGNSQVYSYADSFTGPAGANVKRGASDARFFSSNLEVFGNVISHGYIYGNGAFLTGISGGGGSGGNATVIPSVHFDVGNSGPNQTFSNSYLSFYNSVDTAMSVYINGAYQYSGNYSIAGQTLTIGANLSPGDSVDVGPSGGSYGNADVAAYLPTYGGNLGNGAGYIFGNGAFLTGISGGSGTYGNSNVAAYLPTYTGNLRSLAGNVTTTANVSGAFILGNGRFLTGLPASYSNANVANYLPVYTGNIQSGNLSVVTNAVIGSLLTVGTANAVYVNVDGTLTAIGNITTSANLQGNYVLGNGYFLTGISGGGSTYGNANVANYLPVYGGNILVGNANVTGQARFSNVANLLIPGGANGQYLQTDGNGNVTFANVSATPGNIPGTIQYNYNSTEIRGIDGFIYNYANTPGNVQLTNVSLIIQRDSSATGEATQLMVSGNISLGQDLAQDSNTGFLNIGSIENILPADLSLTANAFTNRFVIVEGERFNYANAVRTVDTANSSNIVLNSSNPDSNVNVTVDFGRTVVSNIVTGNASQIVIGGNDITPNISIATSGVAAGTYGNANALSITVGSDGRVTSVSNVALGATGVTAGVYGNASIVSTFTVGSDGRLTAASNASISLSQGISDGNNNSTLTVPTQTLTVQGTTNRVTSSLSGQIFTLSAPQDLHTGALFQVSGLGAGTAAAAGEVRATGNIIAFFSDDRLKTRLGNIENALDKLDAISTFYFEPNDQAVELGYPTGRYIGVSAQDTQQQVPEIVADAPLGEGYLTVMYEKFAPLLIAAIKELRAEINDIKKKL